MSASADEHGPTTEEVLAFLRQILAEDASGKPVGEPGVLPRTHKMPERPGYARRLLARLKPLISQFARLLQKFFRRHAALT
jgi:hypothetical protein